MFGTRSIGTFLLFISSKNFCIVIEEFNQITVKIVRKTIGGLEEANHVALLLCDLTKVSGYVIYNFLRDEKELNGLCVFSHSFVESYPTKRHNAVFLKNEYSKFRQVMLTWALCLSHWFPTWEQNLQLSPRIDNFVSLEWNIFRSSSTPLCFYPWKKKKEDLLQYTVPIA